MEANHLFEVINPRRLERLRALEGEAAVILGRHIVPGVWFTADTVRGRLEGVFSSHRDALLRFRFDVSKPGRWLSLNFAVSRDPMSADQIIGVVLAVETATPVRFHLRLRTGQSDAKFIDTYFDEAHVAQPGRSTHVSLLHGRCAAPLLQPCAWRTLNVMFEPGSFDMSLLDLHVFVTSVSATNLVSDSLNHAI